MNIAALLVTFGLLIIAMTFHEFAHGLVAYKLGDSTAKYSGRLTLNPLAHIDPVWTIMVPLLLFISTNGQFVFGSAKPVPVNYRALKDPRRDMIWIGASGPLANLLLASVLSLLLRIVPPQSISGLILERLIYINIILGVFNLFPIPPLDGSRILGGILPRNLAYRYSLLEPYGFVIVIIMIWMGMFDILIWPLVKLISNLLMVPL